MVLRVNSLNLFLANNENQPFFINLKYSMTAGQGNVGVDQASDTYYDPSTMSGLTSHSKNVPQRLKRPRYLRGGIGNNNNISKSLMNGMDDNEPSTGSTGSDSGVASVRWTRPRSGLLRRSQSVNENDGRTTNISPKSLKSPSSSTRPNFRLGRPRLKKRSQSLPTERVRDGDVNITEDKDGSKSMGSTNRVRTQIGLDNSDNENRKGNKSIRQRRHPLDMFRPPLFQRKESASKDSINSTKGSFSEESRDGPQHSSSEDESCRHAMGEHADGDNTILRKTEVVPHFASPEEVFEQDGPVRRPGPDCMGFSCSTAILQHSYLDMICGRFDFNDDTCFTKLPEDPTVQESIECIFSSQLEDGLQLWDDEQEELGLSSERPHALVSPAELLQSRQNRLDHGLSYEPQNRKRYQKASLVYVGTYDPSIPDESKTFEEGGDPLPCACSRTRLPALDPKDWPQAPLLLRPTPGSGTKVKGVRFGKSREYLWEPGCDSTWPDRLAQHWGVDCSTKRREYCCEYCAILPINNGNEPHGESLVVDFETDLFEGSILLRLRFSEGTTVEPYDDSKGYFRGMNRRYQAVVRGRFKRSVPFTELVTGFQLQRRLGKLPPKWIVGGGLKVLSFFAPQLQAKLDCDRPRTLAPLGSTPQSISVDFGESDLLEDIREEPADDRFTLLGERSVANSSLQRARARKKAFDKLYANNSRDLQADPLKTYTFEFLQHLFNPQEFYIELGSMLGSVHLEDILDGQPLQIMAAHGDTPLWSFDVWHECLWERANYHERQCH